MEENRLKAHLKKLKADLALMSWRGRIEHLWTYYKWLVFAAIGIGIFLYMILSATISGSREVLISGIGINVPMTEEGIVCLNDDYLTRLGGTKRQTVQYLNEVLDLDNPDEVSYSTTVKVNGLISTKKLDYLMLDQKALDYYGADELFLDLRELFPQETLAHLPILEVDGVPILLDLSDTWFAQTYIVGKAPRYLGFAYNTPHPEACIELWQYLQSGK